MSPAQTQAEPGPTALPAASGPEAAARLGPQALYVGLRERGIEFFTGVPCSYFGGLLGLIAERCPERYVPAAHEGTALALACGSVLAGRPAMVLAQNSGLGNLVNPLASLAMTFSVPILILLSHRGDPDGAPDEPQHEVMGTATVPLMDSLGVWSRHLPCSEPELAAVLDLAGAELAARRTAVLMVRKGGIGPYDPALPGDAAATRRLDPSHVLKVISDQLGAEIVVSTTGYLSRRLFALADRPENFYVQGSMGHASSVALGVAVARPQRRVVLIDGDGACLMHMGALSTIGARAPANLTHLVVDNEVYESTGGQPTTTASTRLDEVALACGYRSAAQVTSAAPLPAAVREALTAAGPTFLVVKVGRDRLPAPPRATSVISADQIRARFEAVLRDADSPTGG
jgi:phosphonopyruvate decarboxylase